MNNCEIVQVEMFLFSRNNYLIIHDVLWVIWKFVRLNL